jgi:hypothetical protein
MSQKMVGMTLTVRTKLEIEVGTQVGSRAPTRVRLGTKLRLKLGQNLNSETLHCALTDIAVWVALRDRQ